MPPTVCTTEEPAKSRKTAFMLSSLLVNRPLNQPMVFAEPAAGAPDPVAEDRVDEAGDGEAVERCRP